MRNLFDDLKSPDYRLVMYEDVVNCMLRGGASMELAQSLLLITHNYFNDDISDDKLEQLVLAAHEQLLEDGGYKQTRNIQQEVSDAVTFRGSGTINIADLYVDLKLTEPQEKSACRMAMNRLVARGEVEKIASGRSGTYRLINRTHEETTFLTVPKGEFKIHLPLDLHTMCKIFPQNIIVVAGSKSAGKTAFMLNIAIENQNKHKVVYLNSEMGDEEFTERMIKLGCNSPEDIKFKCYKKASDYHDLVNGDDAIYIIDFLEIHDKFYEIGKAIKQIHDKLKNGIAIIGIQMNEGARLGRGGTFSKEVARLYLSLDYDPDMKCTRFGIEEMKSPKTQEGYRGWHRYVKIIGGSRLSPNEGWNDFKEGATYEKKASFVARKF